MSEEVRFLPYDEAARLVSAIQEEEDIHRPEHRVLTVYNQDNKDICWFDYEEVMQDVGITKTNEDSKAKLTEYILHRIPDWALDL